MSVFHNAPSPVADPIFGVVERFKKDQNPKKVNLITGVYSDDSGIVPLMRAVKKAGDMLAETSSAHTYQAITGNGNYNKAVQKLIFGDDFVAAESNRLITVQALGGTGALKIGADLLKRLSDKPTKVLISNPSWENHQAIFEKAGFEVGTYAYYNAAQKGIDFDAMMADLNAAEAGTIIVLHACCHNPTGYDLTADQWQTVIDVVKAKQLMPYLDMAYQGFDQGLAEDGAIIRRFADQGLSFLIASSFSKSMGLYGQRVGALSIVCKDADETVRVKSLTSNVIRTNYSNPPIHGAALAELVLTNPELNRMWQDELAEMRDRIKDMRQQLVQGLNDHQVHGVDHIARQTGMFSYSGFSADVMTRLQQDYAIYGLESGRMCVAALNSNNITYICDAIAATVK